MATARLSLTTRIFATSTLLVVVIMAVTLVLAQRAAEKAANRSIAVGLEAAQQGVIDRLSRESGVLAGRLRAHAENTVYRSVIDTREPDYQDYAETAAQQTGALWTQVVSREGILQSRSDRPGVRQDTLTGSPLVSGALDGDTKEAFGVAGDSTLILLAATPIGGGKVRIIGALMGSQPVTDSLARLAASQNAAEVRTDVLFYAIGAQGDSRVAAGTDAARSMSPALLAIASAPDSTGENPDNSAATRALEMNGGHYVVRKTVLNSARGLPVGGFLTIRSLDKQLEATGFADLKKTLFLAGGIGLVLALIISGVSTRQIVRPVAALAEATRRAAEGDYQAAIPEGGGDEIGTLASAFRRLLADLKDKQALVDFLGASASGARTQAMNAAAAAAGQDATMKIPAGMANMTMLSPGKMLGTRYEIKSVLGVGGMGMVYKANDRELGEVLAIKTLKPEMMTADTGALERFKSEIKLARKIAHRNVVRTYDLGEVNGLYYISMEYVEGKSLKDLITERGRLPVSVVLPIAKQLCRALEVSHEEGVIHRDIKPQNMVVQSDGVLKVMDFGIARLATRPKGSGHTEAGMVVGTPEYMAPEQLLGDELDARADLYSTGAVLYECLTGRVPITADSAIVLISRVLEVTPQSPREVVPDVPQKLSDLVMWVLQKERDKRPASAAALHRLLDEVALD